MHLQQLNAALTYIMEAVIGAVGLWVVYQLVLAAKGDRS